MPFQARDEFAAKIVLAKTSPLRGSSGPGGNRSGKLWLPKAYVILENFKWDVDLDPSDLDMLKLTNDHKYPDGFGPAR